MEASSTPPAEAHTIDSQQHIQLESAYEDLENAGIRLEDIRGTKQQFKLLLPVVIMIAWGTRIPEILHSITWQDVETLPFADEFLIALI